MHPTRSRQGAVAVRRGDTAALSLRNAEAKICKIVQLLDQVVDPRQQATLIRSELNGVAMPTTNISPADDVVIDLATATALQKLAVMKGIARKVSSDTSFILCCMYIVWVQRHRQVRRCLCRCLLRLKMACDGSAKCFILCRNLPQKGAESPLLSETRILCGAAGSFFGPVSG